MAINLYQDGMGTGPTAQYWTAPTSPWTSGASYAGGSVARYTGNGWVSDSNVAENKDVSLLNGESGVVGVQAFFQDISGVPFKDLGLAVEWFSKNSSLRCDWIRIFILSADASTVKEVIWSYNVNAATTTMPSFFNSATYGVPSVTDYDMINDRVGIEITFTNTGTITHAATMTGIDLQWQNGNWRGYSDATGYAVLAANKAPIWIKSGGVDNFRTTTNVKTDTQYYLRIGDTAGTTHDTWGFLNGNSFYLAYASVNAAGYLGVGYGATTYKVWARPEEDSNFYRDAFSITFITQHYDANVLLYNNGTGYIFSYHRYSTATHRMKTYKTTDYGVTWALHLTANLVYTTGIAAYAGMQVSEANNGYHCWIYRDSASNGRALIMNGTTAYYVVFDGGGSTTTQVVGTIPTTNSSNSVFAIWIDSSSNLKATSIDLSTQTVGSTSTIDTSVTGWITPTYDDHNEKGFVCYHKSDNVIKTAMYDGTWNISSITTSYQDGALLHDPVNNDVYLMYQDTQYQSQFGCVVKWNNTTDAWDPHVRRCRTGNLPGQNELYMKIQNGFMNLDGFDPRYNDMEPYDETGMWDFHDWNLDYIWPDNGNTSRTWRAIGESPDGSWAVFFCTQTNTQGVAHTLKSAKSLLGGKEKNQIFGLGANWLTRQKSTGEGIFASYQENNFSLGRKNENKIGKHEMEFPVYFPSSNLSNGDTIDLRLTRGTNSGTSTYLVNYPQLTIGTAEFPYTYVDGQSDDLTVAETYDTLLVTALFEGITISLASLSASSSSISVADGCSVNEVVGYGFFDFLADTFNALDSNYITYFMDADDGWTVDDSTQLSTTVFLLDLLTASLSVDTKHVVQCLEDLKAVGAFSSKMTQTLYLLDGLVTGDSILVSFPTDVLENIGVADAASLTVEQAVALLENVLVEGDHFYNGVMSTHTGEMIRLSELIIYGQYAQLLDSLSVSEDLNLRLLMSVTPQSSLNASETSQTSVAGYLSNEDDVDLNDSNLSKWISTTEIEEDLKVGNFFTEDSIKGWVMNPENYAITNYTLGFTGAANFGSDYLFADDTGLYALEGTTDNGAEISSIITTAALDFGLDDIKQVPQVLLGTNGTDLILKVSIDGEYTAIYRHEGLNSDLETKRFKIGKGLVATNWQFSLYTINNSNLNLDSFEFYPVVFKRKHNG